MKCVLDTFLLKKLNPGTIREDLGESKFKISKDKIRFTSGLEGIRNV